jgi:hypothetical protein
MYVKIKEKRWYNPAGTWYVGVLVADQALVRTLFKVSDEREADFFLAHPDRIEQEVTLEANRHRKVDQSRPSYPPPVPRPRPAPDPGGMGGEAAKMLEKRLKERRDDAEK